MQDEIRHFFNSLVVDSVLEKDKYRKLKHYYCITCGKEKEINNFRSCENCYDNYKLKVKYDYCLLCGNDKEYDNKGLCYLCYKTIKSKNEERNLENYDQIQYND